jgi:hypothetical protein
MIGSQVRALVRPPSSLRKPEVSDTTPNRAFPRGFSATQFPDLGLRGRSYIFGAVFGALSPHPKIPFPAAVVEGEVGPHCTRNSEIWATVIRDLDRRCSYSGLSPSASNCRLHSIGGSRSLSMPTPRSRRPSTGAGYPQPKAKTR